MADKPLRQTLEDMGKSLADPLCKACSGTGMVVDVLGAPGLGQPTRGFCDCTKAKPMPQVYVTQAPGGTSYGKKLDLTMLKSRQDPTPPMHVAKGAMDALNFCAEVDAEFEAQTHTDPAFVPSFVKTPAFRGHAVAAMGTDPGVTVQNTWSDQPTTPETPDDWDKTLELMKLFAKKHPGPDLDPGLPPVDLSPKALEGCFAVDHPANIEVWADRPPENPPTVDPEDLEALRRLLDREKKKERGMQHPLVSNFQVEYRDHGNSYGNIGPTVSRFSGAPEIIVKIEMMLPPDADPNELLNRLKDPDMWAGGGAPPTKYSAVAEGMEALKAELKRAQAATLAAEIKANEIARTLVTRDTEIAKLKQTALRHPDTEALLTLRKRMNVAIQAIEDAGLARELYEEVVRDWSHTIQEGASFTQAEGDDLVERLVQFIQYIDTARATKKTEKKPVKSRKRKKDQLF